MLFTFEKQQEKSVDTAISKGIAAKENEKSKFYFFVKRLFDILGSLFFGILLILPLLVVGLIIKIDSRGPVVFKQERLGKDGKVFYLYKFRTLTQDAPSDVRTNDFENIDEYITKVGKVLRTTSIDELPQLWNILVGDMSFVGYRPVCLTETDLNDLRAEYGVFVARPGLTGLAQISGRDNIDYIRKAQLDKEYVDKQSLKMDMYCLFKTVTTVLKRDGVK